MEAFSILQRHWTWVHATCCNLQRSWSFVNRFHPVAKTGPMASRLFAKDAKADVKLGRNDGGTALMFAAQEGHLEVAKQLGRQVWWPLQLFAVRTSIDFLLHPGKLTCPLKRDYFSREYIFQPLIFRGHVSFGCMLCMVVSCCVVMTNGFVSSSPWCYYVVNNLNIMAQHCRLRFYSQTFDKMRAGTYCQPLLAPSNTSKDGIDFFWIFSIFATQGFDWAATRCLGAFSWGWTPKTDLGQFGEE